MDFEQTCSTSTFSNFGVSIYRPVCITCEQTDTDILFMDSSSNSFGIGCVDIFRGRDVRLCISPDLPYSESVTVHTTIQMHNNSNSPILAQTTLVSKIITTSHSASNKITRKSQPVVSTSISNSSSESRGVPISGMVVIDVHPATTGFSEKARKLLRSSRQSSTQADYNAKYKRS
ncbi:hypothetical protein DPMN_070571 [Dreissena polymorpha]|uniref:Uncharacterized protein n=1 Tax=Dreissena polymorpha TaxID=45954 RepID=A0A9D3Z5C6_DREPO|nr:hypothetical protein DPMN_070571 [Dreissena polymorpha]